MAYGIDSTLQDKVNAFRGQPQQLMQQYGQSQQLVDLLALQQIKSEKEAAARQIQMAMAQKQGQPTTIAQQREQEVMGLTRNEIAKQVQQGMPQQPQAPQQAPQQGPQGGGISALPAPNMQGMQNMAGGGIVAFAGPERSDVPNPDDGAPENETEDERTLRIQKYLAMVQADKERQAPLISARQAAREAANQRATQGDPGTGENALASMMASLNAPGAASGNTASLSPETPDATGKPGVDISQEAYQAMKAREQAARDQKQSAAEAPPVASSGRTNVARDNLALRPLKRQEGIASLRAEAEGDNRAYDLPPRAPAQETPVEELLRLKKLMSDPGYKGAYGNVGLAQRIAQLEKQMGGAGGADYVAAMQHPELIDRGSGIADYYNQLASERQATKQQPPATVADKAAPVTQAAPVAPAYSGPMGKGIQSLTNLAPDSVDIDAINRRMSTAYPGMEGIDKQRADAADKLAQLYAKQNDPERLRQEKIHAFLSGLSHGATAASGLGLASEGVAETGKAQDAAKVMQIKELQASVEGRAKELMAMGMERSKAVEKAIGDQGQINANIFGTRSQAASAANQTAASRENANLDFKAAMAGVNATNARTAEESQKALLDYSAKIRGDQTIKPADILKLRKEFDDGYSQPAIAEITASLADAKGKKFPSTPEGKKIIADQLALAAEMFIHERIGNVQPAAPSTSSAGWGKLNVK